MIQISNVCKNYGRASVLKNISMDISSGEIFGLVGRSGAGKSTLLRCINGLETYDSGSVRIDGMEIQDLGADDLRALRRSVGMVFQNFSLLSRLSVYENVALAMRIWGTAQAEIDARVKELLELVEIPDKIYSRPRELSGGQKQRVAIARSLAMNPKILLCDEATSALDPKSTKAILNLLDSINRSLNITVVMVTHEMDVVKSLCDRMAVLENGEVRLSGSVRDIFTERPPALQNLLGSSTTIPADGISFEMIFDGSGTDSTVMTRMAREMNIDFRIISSSSMTLRDGLIESIIINADAASSVSIQHYLDSSGIRYRRLTSEAGDEHADRHSEVLG